MLRTDAIHRSNANCLGSEHMEQSIGRPRVARAYAWLIALATLMVVVQGFLFAGFYAQAEKGFIDVHSLVADISLIVVVLIITPLAFLARFPREPLNNSAQAWMGRVVPFFGDVQASL